MQFVSGARRFSISRPSRARTKTQTRNTAALAILPRQSASVNRQVRPASSLYGLQALCEGLRIN